VLGCGGGGVALALAAEGLADHVLGTDIDGFALGVARQNAERHPDLSVKFSKHDLWAGIDGRFDLIVCQPARVRTEDIPGLPPEYADRTRTSLDGGTDGMDMIRPVVRHAAPHLTKRGFLQIEVGQGMFRKVGLLAPRSGLELHRVARCRTHGVKRFVAFRRQT
jgi:HemK-like putative methylase